MQYRGGKNRFAKEILAHMPHCHTFVEPFVGGGGMTRHAVHCGKFGEFFCSDANEYVIDYYNALKAGWLPRDNYWPGDYLEIKEAWKRQDFSKWSRVEMILCGYVMSLYGFFMNKQKSIGSRGRSPHKYPIINAKKDLLWINKVNIRHCAYECVYIPDHPSVIYCDPPYAGTSGYINVPKFDHDKFYDWVRNLSKQHYVYISEVSMPVDFECIWFRQLGGNGKMSRDRVERLFIHKEGIAKSFKESNTLFN